MMLVLFYKMLEWKFSKRFICLLVIWLYEMYFWFSYFENFYVKLLNIRNVLIVYFNFIKFIVCIFWIVVRVCNIWFLFIVVNNVVFKNRIVDFLV